MAYTTIDDPSVYFQAYTFSKSSGAGSATFDGNSDLQPDFLWVKSRSNADSHELWDSTRGVNATLFCNVTEAEDTSSGRLSSFNTDGFTWGTAGNLNAAGDVVSWAWKANGGTTSSNTDGSIPSTVQANTDAGFSIVTWTSNGSAGQTIGHGLGVAPDAVILKNRSATEAWQVYHQGIGAGKHLMLNSTNAEAANTNIWSNTSPTSTLFYAGTNTFSSNNDEIVMYCFAEKQGYSKFGKFVGNASTDGPFVYTGFKPAWLMIKNADVASTRWRIIDAKINPFNVTDTQLFAEDNLAENTNSVHNIDLLSNGFMNEF